MTQVLQEEAGTKPTEDLPRSSRFFEDHSSRAFTRDDLFAIAHTDIVDRVEYIAIFLDEC